MKILIPSSTPTSTPATALVASITLRQITNRTSVAVGTIIGLNSHGHRSPTPQYYLTTTLWSPRPPARLIQFDNSRYLCRCQICGIIGHFARQCSYLSTSALASLPPAPPYALRLTFTTSYAHTTLHYSNTANS